eukprot:m.256432 g.256432  ORF g.256432 m.256432 type:complete len:297 (-) comp11017_c1_seq14:2116-3006(-)
MAAMPDHVVPLEPLPADKPFQAAYELDETQKERLAQFREKLTNLEDPVDIAFCDDPCLVRYLRARDYNVAKAEKLLRDTLTWRREYGIADITPEEIESEQESGKLYVHGRDRLGRPVMYQRPRRQNTKNYALQVRQVAYHLEREVGSMDKARGVEQHVIIIDFKGYSIWNAPPMSQSKEVLSLLMDRFPERLGNAFLVDAPRLFYAAWAVLKPFMSAATIEKVHFVNRSGNAGKNGKMDKHFAQCFDDEQLEEEYGGMLSSEYNHEKYWAREKEIFKQLRENPPSDGAPAKRVAAL